MIFLHKLLPLLVSPLIIFLAAFAVGVLLKSRLLQALAFVFLLIVSNPLVGRYSTYALEKDYAPQDVAILPKSDAVVVLSGMIRPVQKRDGDLAYEFSGAVDRFLTGLDAIRQEKAGTLIFTRGQLPWVHGKPEGEVLKKRAIGLGVSPDIIRLTQPVENTEDEARAVKAMLTAGENRIILVTSAFHMPRAAAVFEAQGLKVVPLAVDFQASADAVTPMDLFPSASALVQTSQFFRETLGRLYYAVKYRNAG